MNKEKTMSRMSQKSQSNLFHGVSYIQSNWHSMIIFRIHSIGFISVHQIWWIISTDHLTVCSFLFLDEKFICFFFPFLMKLKHFRLYRSFSVAVTRSFQNSCVLISVWSSCCTCMGTPHFRRILMNDELVWKMLLSSVDVT